MSLNLYIAVTPFIEYQIENAIAIISLNRPEKFNAFNREMALRLQDVLDDCVTRNDVRVVYLTGKGRAFSAGQDLSELLGENPPPFKQILSEHYNPVVTRIRNMGKPVICAVNGIAAGAGANIALCCDIVVASESAAFLQAFSKIGLIPDSGGTYILPRLIGWQKASAIMMLGDKISAFEAERMGMIYRVIPDADFFAGAMEIALTISRMPARALAYTKQALNASFNNSFDQQLKLEDSLQILAAGTRDYSEGLNAFIEKRQANFTGE